jgi:hypothetical protein
LKGWCIAFAGVFFTTFRTLRRLTYTFSSPIPATVSDRFLCIIFEAFVEIGGNDTIVVVITGMVAGKGKGSGKGKGNGNGKLTVVEAGMLK